MARKVLIIVGKERSLEYVDKEEYTNVYLINEFDELFDLDTLLNHKLRARKIISELQNILKYEYLKTQDYYFYLDCSIGIAIDILKFLKENWKTTYHLITPIDLGKNKRKNKLTAWQELNIEDLLA